MRTRTLVLADVRQPPGVVISPAIPVPLGTTRIGLAIARKAMTDLGRSDVLDGFVEVSVDGVLWVPVGGVSTSAKPVLTKQGGVATETTVLLRLPGAFQGLSGVLARARLTYFAPAEGAVEVVFDDTPLPIRLGGHRSVSYDNDNEATATAATSVTIGAFAVGNNANRHMIVGVASWDTLGADSTVSTVSHNGSTAGWAQIIMVPDPAVDGTNRSALWGKTAPDVVTATVVVTMGGTCAEIGANALSSYGVDQATATGTPASATGDNVGNPTVTVSGVLTGELVYDTMYVGKAISAAGADQTLRANSTIVGTSTLTASTQPGSAGGVMSWTMVDSDTGWAICAVAIKAAAAGGGAVDVWRVRPSVNWSMTSTHGQKRSAWSDDAGIRDPSRDAREGYRTWTK